MLKAFALPFKPFKVSTVKNVFKTAESRFILFTGLKFGSICVLALLIIGYQLYNNARLNFYFFRANGYSSNSDLQEAYFDYVLSNFTETLPFICIFIVVVFFLGLYIATLILRPFKNIGAYSTVAMEEPEIPYIVDQFAGHRLVTRFSELFFDYLRTCRKNNKLEERTIPPQYMGIHGPVFDGAFIFHFLFFIVIMTILSVVMIMHIATDIHQNTIQLAIKILKADPKVMTYFFNAQSNMLDELWLLTGILVCALNLLLAIHLYHAVAGAAFGIFATMRSFIKGNHSARVHLVGYSYLRDSTRQLNKYLDWIQKNLSKPHGRS